MTPEAQLALIAIIPGTVAAIFAYLGLRVAQDAQRTSTATHMLVNSSRGEILLAVSTQLRRIADLTEDPTDVTAAETALGTYQEHMRQQEVVNAKAEGTPAMGTK